MKLFLTSAIGATIKKDGKRCAGRIDNRYGFLTLFQKELRRTKRMLYISAFYDEDTRVTDWYHNTIDSLKMENITFEDTLLVNAQNASQLETLLNDTDVVFLSGGHLPTQNQLFADIQLKSLLKNYQGILVAQSAGSMNCASTVYVCPEMPGEAIDPGFQRFRPGLGLTERNIIPHYNANRLWMLDGMRFYEEIIAPDTFRIPLYLLTDGSFFYISEDQSTAAYGKMYLFHRGKITPYPTQPLIQ